MMKKNNLYLHFFVIFIIASCGVESKQNIKSSNGEIASLSDGDLYRYTNQTYKLYERKVGDESSYIVLKTLVPRSPVDGPAVYLLGGGPNSPLIRPGMVRQALFVYGDIASRISFVAYAGTAGFDGALEQRLRQFGLPSFDVDTDLLLSVINEEKEKGYIVQTVSLSTPIGLRVFSRNENIDNNCALGIFLAPWTHYYPSDFVYSTDSKPVPSRHRTLEERTMSFKRMALDYLHIDEDVESSEEATSDDGRFWLSSVRRQANIEEDIFVGLPSFENRMDLQVAKSFFRSFPGATVWQSNYDYHETLVSSPDAQRATRAFVKARVPLDGCL